MGILSITTSVAGQVGVQPRTVRIVTTDSLATVTTAGYLNNVALEGYNIFNTDVIDMWYGAVGGFNSISSPGTFEIFTPSISNGIITLVQWSNPGNVLLPVVSGDFAVFNGTSGQIKDAGFLPSNAALTNVVMQSGASVIGNAPKYNDVKGTLVDSGVAFSSLIASSVTANTQSIAGNLLLNGNPVVASKVVTAGFAALATAGKVNIFVAPTVTAQIAILDLKVFLSTGLSGGGGNRLLSLADGTLVFNNAGITAALLGTPIFTLWGGTGNPIASSSEATISTAGANVFLQYIGGTTDYTAGSVIVAVTYAQVTT